MKNTNEPPRLALFEPLLEQIFRGQISNDVVLKLELIEAKALTAQKGAPRQDPFTLLFRAPPECDLGQGMVRVEHEKMGPVDLFLVPVGRDQEGVYLEAVFN